MKTPISESQVSDVCKRGMGEVCCSFLMMGPPGWVCAKSAGNEGFRVMIDERREAKTIRAMGDNCQGWGE